MTESYINKPEQQKAPCSTLNEGVSPGTLRSYQYDLRMLMRFLLVHCGAGSASDDIPEDLHAIDISSVDAQVLARVTLSDLHAFLSHVGADRANSARTRSRKVDSIRSFFTWMVEKAELLPNNPALELESPKFQKRKPRGSTRLYYRRTQRLVLE